MNRLTQIATASLFLSVSLAIFLAFGWPFAISPDPSGELFRVLAIATLVVFLVSLASLVVLNVALRRVKTSGEG